MAEIRQKIISCPKGHYYDANRYTGCPYCGTGGFSPTVDPFAGGSGTGYGNAPSGAGIGVTIGATADVGNQENYGAAENYGNFGPTEAPPVKGRIVEAMNKTQFVDNSTPVGAPAPVVGWLVAVEGVCRGTDYRIHTGYNYIGREAGDICIHGDNTISAEKDANVTFVPQTKKFYIAHEQGKNVLMVNDLPVIGGGMELHDYDVITIGTTKLLFIGLCGEKFHWGDE